MVAGRREVVKQNIKIVPVFFGGEGFFVFQFRGLLLGEQGFIYGI